MKFFKRLLIGLFVLLLLGVGFLITAPMLFQDQIEANIKTTAEKALDAELEFRDLELSFLKSFPDISLGINELSVTGIDTFAGVPLVTSDKVTIDLTFWSVVRGKGTYVIDAVDLKRPSINLLVINPELANYLIVPEDDTPAEETNTVPASAQIELQKFTITDGSFVYDDRAAETYLEVTGLTGSGDGDFTSTIFDLLVAAEAEELTLRQSGVTYLNKIKTIADGMVNIDLNQNLYTFLENKVTLNALDLVFGGSIDLEDDGDIVFDLEYSAPANDFRQLWSLIPSAYTAGYEQVKTRGTFTLSGTVDGPYNGDKEQYPAFTVNTDITGGSVQYPGRPIGIEGIDAQLSVNSPSSDFDQMIISISRFDFNLGGDPFRGRLHLATLLSDPQIDGRIDGKVDLGKWSQAIPLEGVRELSGLLTADLVFDGLRQSLLNDGRYDDLNLGGLLQLTDFVYVSDEYPAIKIADFNADVSPQVISIANFTGNLGRSDLQASGTINDPLAYFSPEQTMRGDLTLRSDFFDADEWVPAEETPETVSPAELDAASAIEETAVFDRFDFTVDAEIGALNYAGYRPENLKAIGSIKPNQLDLATASGQLGESDFAGSGSITNLFDYTFGEGVLGGQLSLRSNKLNLDDFMDEEVALAPGTASEEPAESAVIPVPNNINLSVDVSATEIKYTDVTLKNVLGELLVREGAAVIEDGSAALLGGRMKFAGAYDTSEPGDPGFRFHYDLQSLDFKEAFSALNSFAALAPLGKFLEGQFSSDLVIEGKLGEDLFPKLNTIDAKGIFQTSEAQLSQFKPAQKIGEALDIREFKESTAIKNLMTVFQIEDGRVTIEPFDTRIAGIPLTVQGTHGLDMDMDYQIKAAIPRSLIQGNIVTGTALSALDQLAGQAGRLGLNISPGDTINVSINLGGSISNPTTKFNLLGTNGGGDQSVGGAIVDNVTEQVTNRIEEEKERAQAEVDARVEAARLEAEARLDSLRQTANNRAQEIQDSIRRVVAAEAERLRKEAAERLKFKLDSMKLDSLKKVLSPGAQEAADKLKKELEKFNPFKKKKKGGGR